MGLKEYQRKNLENNIKNQIEKTKFLNYIGECKENKIDDLEDFINNHENLTNNDIKQLKSHLNDKTMNKKEYELFIKENLG